MSQEHQYNVKVTWTGNTGCGTRNYTAYSRSHILDVAGKPQIALSSDPSFRGDADRYNPEELLVASLSSCHMLWFLHLCADAGVVVESYGDNATGKMTEDKNGGRFTQVTLQPAVVVAKDTMIEACNELHAEAHRKCYIANSCNFPVKHRPACTSKETR